LLFFSAAPPRTFGSMPFPIYCPRRSFPSFCFRTQGRECLSLHISFFAFPSPVLFPRKGSDFFLSPPSLEKEDSSWRVADLHGRGRDFSFSPSSPPPAAWTRCPFISLPSSRPARYGALTFFTFFLSSSMEPRLASAQALGQGSASFLARSLGPMGR